MTEFDFAAKYRGGFRLSELGLIYEVLPLKEIADAITKKMPPLLPYGD